jgi:hypothetical protein
VDDSPVYSIHPFGRDHFAVGSGQDALVKLFDMRMPGTDAYSYLNAHPSRRQPSKTNTTVSTTNGTPQSIEPINNNIPKPHYASKNISIFLSYQRFSSRNNTARYRGPVYCLSAPSPSSSTLYAGVENLIYRLDFASTDDIAGPSGSWYHDNLGLDLNLDSTGLDRVLGVPCYERPPLRDMGRGMKLLTQKNFSKELMEEVRAGTDVDVWPGWDQRWKYPVSSIVR